VLRTRLYDTLGQGIEITDLAPRFQSRGRFFRPLQLVRRIHPLSGAPRMRVVLRPVSTGAAKCRRRRAAATTSAMSARSRPCA
jgi:hypothetical protein